MEIELHEIMIKKMVDNFKNEKTNIRNHAHKMNHTMLSNYESELFKYLDNPANEIVSTTEELDEYNALMAEKAELENDVEMLAEVMRMEEN